MKKIYLLFFISFLLAACTRQYQDRIIGTWNLVDIDKRGIGGSISNQTFQNGTFTFREDGTITWTTPGGVDYHGSWDIDWESRQNNCYTDSDGGQQCNYDEVMELFVSVTDPISQHTKKERFDEIQFTSSNRFKAIIYSDFQTYIFIFRK
jgi:hypothetical protein